MNVNLVSVISAHTSQTPEQIMAVAEEYPFAIPKFLLQRVVEGSYSREALLQYAPNVLELEKVDGFVSDPTGESELHPEEAVLQTYGNRLAVYVTQNCLVYCRFCFRKEFVGKTENKIHEKQLEKAVRYIKDNPKVTDVLLSGGDPLAVSNRTLIPLLRKLAEIDHLKTIRIHSRAISAMPERIDDELVNFLSQYSIFWYYGHMNHPDDIGHPDVISAIRRLQKAGIPIMNQCVLLKGINDSAEILKRLMLSCYENRVIPYNLYLLDRVKGAAHFDVPRDRVIEIYHSLSELPGPAQPVLVYVDNNSRKHRYINSPVSNIEEFLSWRDKA